MFENLPLEVIEFIARQDNATWYILVQCFKFLAEKSADVNYMDNLKRKFLVRRENYKEFRVVYYLPNREFHNYEEPSIISNGIRFWCKYGEIHRCSDQDNDEPAIIHVGVFKSWYQYGELHRDNDLPAIIWNNGSCCWYQHDKLHRDHNLKSDHPAVIHRDGRQEYYRYGALIL